MTDPEILRYSRILTDVTLSFHIIFAVIGVGVPLMIALAEWVGIKRNDPHYTLMARRWARGFTITVAVGVVTGTAIGILLSILWPRFMQLAGQAIALPLFMETFAFFFEAIFLGIYLYTWDRFKKPIYHFLLVIPVAIGSSFSAIFITMVNAFMNTPQGFDLVDGKLTNIDPLAAMLNPAVPTKIAHVLTTAYMTCAFILAALAAVSLLKKRTSVYHKKALHLSMKAAIVFAITTILVGDLSGKFLAEYQPEKLAAAEWHFETTSEAPLVLGGILTEDQQIKYGLTLPYMLSILAHGTPGSEVIGLNEFPAEEKPPLYVHYLFDGMVFCGVLVTVIAILYFFLRWIRKGNPYHPWLLRMVVVSAPLSMLAIELGWTFAEVGRQPWIIKGYMKTADAVTTSEHVGLLLIAFSLLYLVLAISVVKVLRKLFKDNPPEKEMRVRGITEDGGVQL